MLSMAFSPESIAKIAELYGMEVRIKAELPLVEQQIGDLIIQITHDNALSRFMTNSPGGLAESFALVTSGGGGDMEVGTSKPHGHRRDAGFDGADSLGRVYHDPPTWFFTDAVTEVATGGEGMAVMEQGFAALLGGL